MKQSNTNKIYNAALYLRLSRDDELQGESGSIQTQRMMLREYAKENRFNIVDEYIDDGWSGTNFDRPGFQRMIDDIEDGKVNCVITKDLSRLGRNYILTGQYTEIYFPSKGVRYIAINDNVDTEKGDSELAPFLNILNEMHSRETSKKVKAAVRTRFLNGARFGPVAPLGYRKDPDDNCHLIVDEETKWIIEKIFGLALHGMGAFKISKALRDEKIPTPSRINYERFGKYAEIHEGADGDRAYEWSTSQVQSILSDETYIGHSIHNKRSNISFKNKKNVYKPEEEWIRVENTHEAIISEETFHTVQKLISSRKRSTKGGQPQIFAGLLKCADCKSFMKYGVSRQNSNPLEYYICGKYAQGKGQCTIHYTRYDVLYQYVLSRLRYWSEQVKKDDAELVKRLTDMGNEEYQSSNKKRISELRKAEKRKGEVDNLFLKVYEDRYSGKLSEANFDMLAGKYQAEQTELEEKILTLKKEIESLSQKEDDSGKWISIIRQYSDIEKLTPELLNSLIEKIVIHQAVKNSDGTKEQKVEIYYRFIGKIE